MIAPLLLCVATLSAPPAHPPTTAQPRCAVDLLDAGDGSAIRLYGRRIRSAGFHLAHTGLARDPHSKPQIFYAEPCGPRAQALAKALGIPPAV